MPEDRVRALVVERNRKMAESAHAYVRGSTKRFYEWLSQSEHAEIPTGPAIWICGDCHSGNLGPVANGDGALAIQIRDLDQTVIGNPVHDLIRLALSLATAARSSDLPGVYDGADAGTHDRRVQQSVHHGRRHHYDAFDNEGVDAGGGEAVVETSGR